MRESKFKVGDQVRIIRKSGSHLFPIGSIVTLTIVNGRSYQAVSQDGSYYNLGLGDFEAVALTAEEIKERINKLTEEIKEEKTKLEFLKATGAEKFHKDEYAAYKILLIVEKKTGSRYEKAKAIVEALEI